MPQTDFLVSRSKISARRSRLSFGNHSAKMAISFWFHVACLVRIAVAMIFSLKGVSFSILSYHVCFVKYLAKIMPRWPNG